MTRVLIVDDKEENVYYLQVLLSGHGFDVETARHGAEALVKARQSAPDLAVSDLLMPVMDGYTLLRYWKADPRLRNKPFIVYTATYTSAADEKLALDLGADAFILKPCEPEAFLSHIRQVQSRGPKQAPDGSQQSSSGELLKLYSETLIRKLEEKTMQLEETNQALQRDIAERKALEQQLLRAQRMESIGTLAGGIAHDLNNLLAPILMGIGLLRRMERSSQAHRVIDGIERSTKRGADLVRQLLSYARGIEGARVAVHLGDIVREVHTILKDTLPKNVVLTMNVFPDTHLVTADPTQLNQVLLNLCLNARDAMPDGGTLTIEVRNVDVDAEATTVHGKAIPGAYVMLAVTDSGSGISKEVADRMFEPFYTTKGPGKGTGLGLSTALGIVRSHGGFLTVDSAAGLGSTFKVFLPMQREATPPATVETATESLPRGHGELILLVDDEAAIVTVAKSVLEMFGYRTATAHNGTEALEVFQRLRGDIALVLTDMAMPETDGPKLIAALRAIDPKVRIIASSGISSASKEAAASAVETGVQHFLPKPYTAESLLHMTQKALTDDA